MLKLKPKKPVDYKAKYEKAQEEIADLRMALEAEERQNKSALDRIRDLDHEVRVIQQGYHRLIQKAEASAALRARKQVTREFEFRLMEAAAEVQGYKRRLKELDK